MGRRSIFCSNKPTPWWDSSGPVTHLAFCEKCKKVWLTSDGKLLPCLGDHLETDLMPALRPKLDSFTLKNLSHETLVRKPAEHALRTSYQPERNMTAIGQMDFLPLRLAKWVTNHLADFLA